MRRFESCRPSQPVRSSPLFASGPSKSPAVSRHSRDITPSLRLGSSAESVPSARSGGGRARGGADACRSAGRDHPLDRRSDGTGERHQRQRGPAHLEGARASAAPLSAIQALERSELRRQAARRGRALCRSAGPRHRAVARREEPNPGSRSHPPGPAAEEAAGQLARANHSHPLVRANPTGDSGGQRLSALPLHPFKGGYPRPSDRPKAMVTGSALHSARRAV